MADSLVTARVVITQSLPADGGDPEITVDTTDGHDGELPMVQILGLLSFATASLYADFTVDDEDES